MSMSETCVFPSHNVSAPLPNAARLRLHSADGAPVSTLNISDWRIAAVSNTSSRRVFISCWNNWSAELTGVQLECTASPKAPGVRFKTRHMRCRRMLVGEVDTLHVEVWMTIFGVIPQTLWSTIAAPDSRLWTATKGWNVPMNVTFLNSTAYVVRFRPSAWLPSTRPFPEPLQIQKMSPLC